MVFMQVETTTVGFQARHSYIKCCDRSYGGSFSKGSISPYNGSALVTAGVDSVSCNGCQLRWHGFLNLLACREDLSSMSLLTIASASLDSGEEMELELRVEKGSID